MQPTAFKIAATVIIYNPDEKVVPNIQSYAKYFSSVYVFDNSSNTSSIQAEIGAIQNVQLFQDFENRGISERLNAACIKAKADNCSWLLTMDQDSYFEDGMIESYLKLFFEFENRDKVSQFGVTLKDIGAEVKVDPVEFVQTDILITSGSFLNLEASNTIGPFDINYFIDQVDNDYCIRSILLNYELIRFTNVYLTHQMGSNVKRSSIKTLYLVKKYKTVHPPLRCYYIYRNLMYFLKKFEGENIETIRYIEKFTLHYLNQSKLYNGSYFKTQRYLNKAKRDFSLNKMGKIDKEY
jgi:rhamnosyltransferase